MTYLISLFIARLIMKVLFRAESAGLETLPKKGPFVAVINHNSLLDVLSMALVLRPKDRPRAMVKYEMFRIPVLKWWLKAVGCFPVARGASDQQAFQQAVRVLKEGGMFYIAPEGTRKVRPGEKRRIHTGFVRLAQTVRCPVVPIAVAGTRRVLPPGAWFPRLWVKVKVRIGEPVELPYVEPTLENRDKLQAQAEWVMEQVYAMVREMEGVGRIEEVFTTEATA